MQRYYYPLASGMLLMLAFFPFYFWPLVLVALAPLFYFAAGPERTTRELVIGGTLVGVIGIGPLIYFSLGQTILIPGALAFSYAVRASGLLTLLLVSILFGAMTYGFARARTHGLFKGALAGVGGYLAFEVVMQWIFDGYYFGSFAHAIVPMEASRFIVSIGGTLLVSCAAVLTSVAAAELVRLVKEKKERRSATAALGVAMLALWLVPEFVPAPVPVGKEISVALIQPAAASPHELPYGKEEGGMFSAPALEGVIRTASQNTSLVIYPFSPVNGATYRGTHPTETPFTDLVPDAKVGEWLTSLVSTSTTVMVWNTLIENGKIYDEYAFWQNNKKESYQKTNLYLFSDFVPEWMRALGFARMSFNITPGNGGMAEVNGTAARGLICSELHHFAFYGDRVEGAGFAVAVGYDAFFPGELVGNFSIASARYYAARTRVPVLRSTIDGPSAIIDAQGNITALLEYKAQGVLRGTIISPQTPERD